MIQWLDDNQESTTKEYKEKRKEAENELTPILMLAYGKPKKCKDDSESYSD